MNPSPSMADDILKEGDTFTIPADYVVNPVPIATCSCCGRPMTDVETGSTLIGMSIEVTATTYAPEFAAAWARIYPELPFPFYRQICYVCWLAPFGPVNG